MNGCFGVYHGIHHCQTVIDLLYCWFMLVWDISLIFHRISSNTQSCGTFAARVSRVCRCHRCHRCHLLPGVSIGHRGWSGWWRTCVSGGLVLGTDCEAEKPFKDHLRGWFKHVQHFAFVWAKNICLPAIFMFTTVLGFWFRAITLYTSHCPSTFPKFGTTRYIWGTFENPLSAHIQSISIYFGEMYICAFDSRPEVRIGQVGQIWVKI